MRWMGSEEGSRGNTSTRAICLGGGAGAEIVALAAAWRDLEDGGHGEGGEGGIAALEEGVGCVSLNEKKDAGKSVAAESAPRLSVAAVDIADWSIVVDRLSNTIASPNVPTQKTSKYQPPLLGSHGGTDLSVTFSRKDVLGLAESDLRDLILGTTTTTPSPSPLPSLLITLMFTLNELFTTNMAKTTGLLLQMTEILPAGAVLLVVDSPGSYSTLKLGKAKDGAAQERQYPMKFLLDHTLLSVAKGKWERVLTQDSRWWRRDVARLRYEVGEGAGLEDMRYQVHVYRRL
jgi:25S rRNA (uracil2843-N3)-methyltransferase